jgi:hypothetical protein
VTSEDDENVEMNDKDASKKDKEVDEMVQSFLKSNPQVQKELEAVEMHLPGPPAPFPFPPPILVRPPK